MAKLQEGDSLANLSAREFNRHVDASDAWHRSQALGPRRLPSNESPIPTDVVKVKLTTSLPRGSVIELGDRLVDELDPHYLWYEGVPSGPNPENFWAITRQQISGDTIGEAQVAGVCIARVDVLNTAHRYARPIEDERYLESAVTGPVRLLTLATSTGEQELAVWLRFDDPQIEVVELTSTTKVGPYYPGRIMRWNPGTEVFNAGEDVWIKDANE